MRRWAPSVDDQRHYRRRTHILERVPSQSRLETPATTAALIHAAAPPPMGQARRPLRCDGGNATWGDIVAAVGRAMGGPGTYVVPEAEYALRPEGPVRLLPISKALIRPCTNVWSPRKSQKIVLNQSQPNELSYCNGIAKSKAQTNLKMFDLEMAFQMGQGFTTPGISIRHVGCRPTRFSSTAVPAARACGPLPARPEGPAHRHGRHPGR